MATIITALFCESIPRSKGLTNFTTLCEQIANSNYQSIHFYRRKKIVQFWESIPRSTCRARPLWGRATIFAGLARLSCKHDTVNYIPSCGALIPILHFSSALIPILPLIEGDQDSAALTPLLKLFTVFNVFLAVFEKGGKMLEWPSRSGEFETFH